MAQNENHHRSFRVGLNSLFGSFCIMSRCDYGIVIICGFLMGIIILLVICGLTFQILWINQSKLHLKFV